MNAETEFKILGKGYVKLIETWGSDERIIESARMSTSGGFKGWGSDGKPGDEKLLRFLYEHKHLTPFEMAGMTIEVQAPIFVFREWHRHRTQSYNEMSGRYSPLPADDYIPTVERLMMGSDGKNKQAGTIKNAEVLTVEMAEAFRWGLEERYAANQELYEQALKSGVPKELARIHLPVGRFSRMRASANLRNWLAFLTLRDDPAAQWEIQEPARCVAKLIQQSFPRTYSLYVEGK